MFGSVKNEILYKLVYDSWNELTFIICIQKLSSSYKIIYVINRSTNDKYAISRDKTDDKDLKAWLADDTETSPLLLSLPQEIWSVVIPELQKEESITDLNGNKTFNSKTDNDTLDVLNRMRRLVGSYDSNTYLTYRDGSYDSFTDYLKKYMITDGDELP